MMRNALLVGIVLAGLLFPAAVRAAGSKTDSGSTPPATNYVSAGTVAAEVIKVDSGKGSPKVTLKVHDFRLVRTRRGTRVTNQMVIVTLPFADDPAVRSMETPQKLPAADGTPQFFTPDELRKMKGNQRYPGFEKGIDELKTGMRVDVHLVKDPQLAAPKPQEFVIDYIVLPKEKRGTGR